MAERTHTVASLPGDGIGPEVVAEARKAVDAAAARFGFGLDWIDYDLGADRYLRTGEVLPDTVLKELGEVDAILLGAVGRPDVGAGGTAHRGTAAEVATETALNSRAGVERCVRFAASMASERDGRLTMVHKTNVLTHSGDLWMRTAREVADQTGVRLDYCHVDAACLHLINDPGRFDVIVTDNLFGDILTDLGAAIAGGLGTAASANLNPVGGSG